MDAKPGWKTTEFWVTVIGEIGAVCAAATGVLPPKYAAALMTISAVAYKISRGLAKINVPAALAAPIYAIEPPGDTTEAPK
jgi:hypothetical protein